MSRRWFLASVALGAAADATSVKDARPLFTPAVKITRTVEGRPAETFPDRPGPSLQLLGPGDSLGFDRSVVVRHEPPEGAPNAVPAYLAHVEFSDASLPWLLSLPSAKRPPWLTLLVLRDDEGDLAPGRLLPVVTVPGSALPDPAESWAWAHVEARVEDGETPQDAVARDVRSGVDNVVSRLICPRRLEENRGWLACVVPSTKAGRAAGLGEPPPADGAAAAWSPGQSQVTLPVYHAWRFRTGPEGSFEDLARRIDPVPTATLEQLGFGARIVDVRHPWPHADVLQGIAPEHVTVPVHGALRLPGADTTDETWTDLPSMHKFRELVIDHLDAPALRRTPDHVGAPPDRDEKAVAAPLYGSHHSGVQTVPAEGWMKQLNTQVKYRIAAALGARYVQLEQEFLMARAWEQIGQVDEANQALAAGELASAAAEAAQAKHLATMRTAALTELATLYSDVAQQPDGGPGPLGTVLDPSAVPKGTASTAFVRLTRPGGALRRRSIRTAGQGDLATMATAPFLDKAMDATKSLLPTTWLAGLEESALPAAAGAVQGPLTTTTVFGDPAAAFSTRTLGQFIYTMWMVSVDFLQTDMVGRPMFPQFGNPRDRLIALQEKATQVAVDRSPRTTTQPVLVRGLRRLITAETPAAPRIAETALGMTGSELVGRIRDRVRPMPRTMDHMTKLLGEPVMSGRSVDDPRPLRPLMRHPEFGFPIAAELLARWPEWAVPGITDFPDDSSALLEPNPAFVEALLVGLNQEFNRELRWREYPTDEAGTPFSRFWPPGGAAPGYGEIARWAVDDRLGDHDPSADAKLLVLLVRAEVLRRYPGTIVLAAKSVNRTVEGQDVTWREPRFVLPVDERTNLYGFEGLTAAQAAAERWMFVMREPMRAAQFGFDERTPDSPPFDSWPNLTWDEVPTVNGFVVPRVVNGLPPTLATPPDPPAWEGLDAGDFARILFQQPFQLAFSAKMMTG
ncbi:hypothetical protein ABTX77_38175 [Streptomyces sp. NPDC097704]|uniref:hypothetical protein n=1 Tax=Streptomyces sp. NPDC097704 TaxID=3157101 RepID=UPI003329E322